MSFQALLVSQAEEEQRDYEELVEWLHQGENTLQIVDMPVHDLQAEYKVSLCDIIIVHREGWGMFCRIV